MAHEYITKADAGTVVLNNVRLKVEGTIGWDLANSYGRKIQQGDPGPDDHPLNSTIIQNSWTGGIGTKKSKGDETRGNSWWSTMWMQTENMLCLPPDTLEYVLAGEEASLAIPHAKLGGVMYGTFGKKMRRWDEATRQWAAITGNPASASSPIAPGVTWGNSATAKKTYIPMGSSYEVWDGANFAAGAGGEGAICFCVWQEKLFKLDSSGNVKFTTNGTSWTIKGTIPEDFTPRWMFVFYDKDNARVLHVTTSGNVYALDFDNSRLVETDLIYPDHPTQGLGATTWRADAFVSVGLGVHRNANGLITAVGPDGREGLPEEYQDGHFVSLVGSYNELLGLIKGGDESFTPVAETADMGMAPPDQFYSQDAAATYSVLMGWNQLGWHPKWIGTKTPTAIAVASNAGVYRAFWGTRGAMYSQILPIGYYNPVYNQNQTPLARYARHETPYHNYGVDDTPKIIKQLEVKTGGCDENNYIVVWVRFDDEEGWGDGVTVGTPLATLTSNGEHHIDIGFTRVADELKHLGRSFERVQFAFDAHGNPAAAYETPVIEWFTIVGRKWMRAFETFNFAVDATQPFDNLSPRKIHEHIIEAATRKGGSTLIIGDKEFLVDVTANEGNIEPLPNYKGFISVSAAMMQEIDD